MTSSEIRQKFIEFFKAREHLELPASSLIPENDPTVLFTTAGMQQFKNWYLHPDQAQHSRVVTIQPCLRTSDIDEVGDESHLTFFEMLGNFSFGYPDKQSSYFKEEAIKMAWEFLTSNKWLGIAPARISATYFEGEGELAQDKESREILAGISELNNGRVKGMPKDENFWGPVGSEGPCGPTVEFHLDGKLEVWNLVFNEYYFDSNKYLPAKLEGVDTGAGLERLAAILQDKKDVFETDLFAKIMSAIRDCAGQSNECAERIIADHLRAIDALLKAGIEPSNKDQGYVLRRLIRSTVVYGRRLGIGLSNLKKLFAQFLPAEKVNIVETELDNFEVTVERALKKIKDKEIVSGKEAFDLYQTYGLPIELTRELVKEVDEEGYRREMTRHKEISRAGLDKKFTGGLGGHSPEETKLHTATHLLLAALRQVLSKDIIQKGSNITAERLRFDFNWPEKLTDEQLRKIEDLVNQKISESLDVKCEEMTVAEAENRGAIGVFKDKYAEKVKLYSINEFSVEICGGPHVANTKELGRFKITKEESSSAGVRRIRAVLE